MNGPAHHLGFQRLVRNSVMYWHTEVVFRNTKNTLVSHTLQLSDNISTARYFSKLIRAIL